MRVRNEAKTNLRRFVDDVLFVVTKESRDRLKNIQRQLRDHYRDIANQTTRSLNESLQATIAAHGWKKPSATQQVPELERQLNILGQVIDNADKLEAEAARGDHRTACEHQRSGPRHPGRHRPAYQAEPAYRERPDVFNELDRIGGRLNQPIRIALAGTLKAGKSTLVNALVGEAIAPTDATEATRIVTWFRHGPTPKVTANHVGGRRSNVPIARGLNNWAV